MSHIPIKFTHCLFDGLSTIVKSITDSLIMSDAKDITLYKTKPSTYSLIIFSLLAAIPGYVYAKSDVIELPKNATAKSYGTGWNCDKGYREKNNACEVVIIPSNAYPTNKSYSIGWECNRGFRKIDNACIYIKIPVNSYLDYSGKQLKCNRGYLMVDKSCKVINVHTNGFLKASSYWPGRECERGYRASKDACIALKLPENSHIDYSGNNWACNRPYQKRNNQCAL